MNPSELSSTYQPAYRRTDKASAVNTTITINMNNAALCTLEQQDRTKLTSALTRHPMTAETSPRDLPTISPTSARPPRDHPTPAPIRSHEKLTIL